MNFDNRSKSTHIGEKKMTEEEIRLSAMQIAKELNHESLCPGDLNVVLQEAQRIYEFIKGEANGLPKAD